MSGQNASEIWMDVCSLSRNMDPAIILAICTIRTSLYYYSGLRIYRGAHYCVTGDIYVLSGQNYVWTPDGHDLFSGTMHLAIIPRIFWSCFFWCSRPLSIRKYVQNPDRHYPCSGTIYLAINPEIVWSYFIWCSRPFSRRITSGIQKFMTCIPELCIWQSFRTFARAFSSSSHGHWLDSIMCFQEKICLEAGRT